MSTRVTYRFESKWHGKQTFYIHSDGYPAGAAEYFFLAARFENKASNGTLAESFFRANERAEFTLGHDAHGDTEYL